jgi:hypothetical protein
MRNALVLTALVAAFAAPSALAGTAPTPDRKALPPLGQAGATLVTPPTPVRQAEIPGGAAALAAPAVGVAASDCGACIVTCWYARARNGASDWSGHIYIFQNLWWCGNGARITSARVSQDYDQQGAYTLTSADGPWWSGGCVGCASIRASGYILWNWRAPLINWGHSDRTDLSSTLWAYGGVSF